MSEIRIVFLVSSEALANLANDSAQELQGTYKLSNSILRSIDTPLDRLLEQPPATFMIALMDKKENESVYSNVSLLQDNSSFPVLEIANANSKSAKDISFTIAKFCSLNNDNFLATKIQQIVISKRQAKLVQDAQFQTQSLLYKNAIANSFDCKLQITGDVIDAQLGQQGKRGKVRDCYTSKDDTKLIMVTTDRQSGFDRNLAIVPFKGAVLNLTSAFWFEQTKHVIPNHLIEIPHPNVSIVKKCQPFPIEFVVRSYMTGSTSTSIWKNYQNGVRNYCGHELPEGMTRNQKLDKNLVTPTTKEEEHDRPISAADIVKEGWMTQEDFTVCSNAALQIFQIGQDIASQHGLILVDTKYEFGKDATSGEIILIDEVHTPDSSRYWLASSYQERIAKQMEPENIDKEFLRLWFRDNCKDPYDASVPLPDAPRDLVLELSRRYITLYEMITFQPFEVITKKEGLASEDSIVKVLQTYME